MSCRMIKTLAASSLMGCLLLNACGGGGGGGAPETSSVPPVITTGMDVDCTGCGATSKTVYSGSGVGVWTYKNTQASAVSLPVSISGLSNNNVTVVYTNQGDTAVTMPSITLAAPVAQDASAYTNTLADSNPKDPAPASILAQREEFARLLHSNNVSSLKSSQAPVYAAAAVGDSRSIYTATGGTTTVTMKKTVTTQDGTVVNFWVDNNEFVTGKITMTTVDTFASKYASGSNSIYTLVTDLIGKPWGTHGYSNLISASQPINIVFYSANNAGWGGYFDPTDEFTASFCSTNACKTNAWLAFYINTQQLYENQTATDLADSTNYYISVLAHEFTHMIHQYQRYILLGKAFATWLNELSAMSMEDIVASKIATDYNTARDQRFPYWLHTGNFNCQQDVWLGLSTVNGCNSYNINGSFGAFLNRQYGIAYYKAMFASSATDSVQIMDEAIKKAGGVGYQDALRRWGDSIALYPAATAPSGHGYPARTDGSYSLVGIDGPAFKTYRVLPTAVPTSLAAHGHFPFVRSGVSGAYSETLTIPANTSVTVVIQ